MDEFSTSYSADDGASRLSPQTDPLPSRTREVVATQEVVYTQVVMESRHSNEILRVKLAWAKLLWLLVFLAALLAISYIVPYVVEETQYASTRGKQRAEHELAKVELADDPLGQLSRGYQLVTKRMAPSVVHISAVDRSNDVMPSSFQMRGNQMFQLPPPGQGSGVIVDTRGYIVTNNHVIRGARSIQVRLSDGRKLVAQLIGQDEESDVAILKIVAGDLIAAEWGDSDTLDVGSLVWAMGSPYGLDQTVTGGIVSAKHRAGKVGSPFQDFLQTDAAVNPGNSGGPLVDTSGKIVGINTAIVGDNYQGISFAIPSSVVKKVYGRLMSQGQIKRGYLGIEPDDMTDERVKLLGMESLQGVFVKSVLRDSPAAAVGMQEGDVVLAWNGAACVSSAQMTSLISETPIGSAAKLTVWRKGEELILEVTVGERPPPGTVRP